MLSLKTMTRALVLLFFLLPRLIDCAPVLANESQPGPGKETNSKILRYALFGSVIFLGTTAAICEAKSDKEYSRYLDTAYPSEIRSSYDKAERYRNLSNAALIGAELCAVGLVVDLLRGQSQNEPRTGGIRLSLKFDPSHAGLTFRW